MKKITLLLILLITYSFITVGQSKKMLRADKNFERFNYSKAIKLYESLAVKEYKGGSEQKITSRLGDSYRLINDTKSSEKWYELAVKKKGVENKNYFYYAQVLKSNKKYDEATKWLKKYLSTNPKDKEAIKQLANFDLSLLKIDSSKFTIKFMTVSSKIADYSPAFYNDKILFISSRDSTSARVSAWTTEPYYDIYIADVDSNYNLINTQKLLGSINSKYHEGPASYDSISQQIFFTRSNYYKKKKGKSEDNTNYLKIYSIGEKDGKWNNEINLSFNDDEYSCAHPTLTADGKTMYFSSNMFGGLGGMDLYSVTKKGNTWSKPKNLGKPINTEGNEIFPFVSETGDLYFASTGHPGLGGLDIFSYKKGKIKNIGYPINTEFDDFGLIINNKNKGYFSSNRKDGYMNDDIYFFEINNPPVAEDDFYQFEVNLKEKIPTFPLNLMSNDSDEDNNLIITKIEIINKKIKGKLSIDSLGFVFYTPLAGFKGTETFNYIIFDETNLKDTAKVEILVLGKNPPIALVDIVSVTKNSENNLINIIKNDLDPDNNLDSLSTEIVTNSSSGALVEVVNGQIKYTPKKEFAGRDSLIYRIFDTGKLSDTAYVFVDVRMLFMGKEVTEGLELNLTIHFATSKWDIRKQAALILDSVVTVLKENPSIKIEMGAHTDSRGSKKANQSLSQKRADSTVAYLIAHGIEAKRMTSVGYGESQLTNKCKDGVRCSKEEHAANRRTTVRVLSF